MFIIEQLQKYVSPSPKSLTILQELQAKEDAERAVVIKKREEKNPPYETKEKDIPNLINPEDLPFNLINYERRLQKMGGRKRTHRKRKQPPFSRI